jgi:hypothetical protein
VRNIVQFTKDTCIVGDIMILYKLKREQSMKTTLSRFAAVLLLVIPGLMATYGFLAMKDAFFAQFGSADTNPQILWGKLSIGFVLFAAGVAFLGGWTFFRDSKRNYVAPRFKVKRKKQ